MTRASAIVLASFCVACGTTRTPLPPPVAPLSATPALAPPEDTSPWTPQVPAVPEIRTVALASGITVQLVPRHEAPVVYAILEHRTEARKAESEADFGAVPQMQAGD